MEVARGLSQTRKRSAVRSRRRSSSSWEEASTQDLLDLRICDLQLDLEECWLSDMVERVRGELQAKGLARFRPHFYLSDEWLSPDGVPGVGLPFYLAHPRLTQLERKMMYEVEGSTVGSCLKLLRHELGHAVQHAYQLQRKRRWQNLFGRSSKPYPESYTPRVSSKRYVIHLDGWYAQSHPDEDFAETFAVWLDPRSAWRKRYRGWGAIKKLEYVDDLMASIGEAPQVVKSKAKPYAAHRVRKSLRAHYEERRNHYHVGFSSAFDRDLNRLFDAGMEPGTEPAAKFLRRSRREIRELVARWTGDYIYAVDAILTQMIGRCRELKLRTTGGEGTKNEFMVMLTMHSMTYVYKGRDRRPV